MLFAWVEDCEEEDAAYNVHLFTFYALDQSLSFLAE